MNRITKLFATGLVGASVFAAGAQAQEMKFFRIGTGSAGGTYFPIGGIIANAISNPPGVPPLRQGRQLRRPRAGGDSRSPRTPRHIT